MIDRSRLAQLLERERRDFRERNPRSAAAYEQARAHLFGGVPMTWMNKTAAGFPLYLSEARGARVVDVDGHEYVDLCLGDTGAMAGHSPAPTVEAVTERFARRGGATVMMPTEDAAWVGAELGRRFGVPYWSFSLTATDANRWAIRLARAVTGRPRILVNSYCYHGSVDEVLLVVGPDGRAVAREGNVGAPVDPTLTSRVVEFNDLASLERELAHGDVAAVLMEPALTNIGIVLPRPGYLEGVRELTRRYGSLLINDETHTFSAGPGGCTRAWRLEPDVVTIGKAVGGGIPSGGYGLSAEVAARVEGMSGLDLVDMGGVGGTLAGNALSIAAMRATLEYVLTDEAFAAMEGLAVRFTEGVLKVVDAHALPWSVVRLGARAEYRFTSPAPRNGGESNAAADPDLDDYLHVYLANRGVLLTPFHNMALMCPATTAADVDRHNEAFADAVRELAG
ncbi:aminotransferase class III-fold pyridoxal phosphate-dependent enzyme [Planomonospora sp. ID67723]|uniref:transaminase n=1 Tax=Planomonospora sp. ID67723 TaxID=2738134 RepID=UPI0018C39002|nr:transaminase [Planomonospora sp. ID67723]MBG0831935.1 aminotransferase class III-fold pyridoxal phosphate-dependent enzyme [Planomonospora sp. ID67723]